MAFHSDYAGQPPADRVQVPAAGPVRVDQVTHRGTEEGSVAEPDTGKDPNRYEVLTWPLFGEAVRELATQVAESGYEPDIVLAIARGGLIPAGCLGYALSVKNTFTPPP